MLKHSSVFCVALALIFIPLPKAGKVDWAEFIFVILIVLAMVFYMISQSTMRNKPVNPTTLKSWFLVFIAMSAIIALQITILPRLYSWSNLLNFEIYPSLGARPVHLAASLHYWAMFCTYWVLAFLVSQFSARHCRMLLWVITISLLFQVTYGLAAYVTQANNYLGIWQKSYYLGLATGTFVNHNHFAGFIAICWPISMSFLTVRRNHLGTGWSSMTCLFFKIILSILCLLVLIASASRMGLFVSFLAVSLWFWGISAHTSKKGVLFRILCLTGFWLIFLIIGLWYGFGEVIERFFRLWIVENRWEIWANMLKLPTPAWLFGLGAGSFSDIYSLIHLPNSLKVVLQAHNDYLEFLLEFGLFASLLILVLIANLIKNCLPKQFSFVRWGALCAIIAVLLHSLVDFDLQIPATAAYFWTAVGLMLNKYAVSRRTVYER